MTMAVLRQCVMAWLFQNSCQPRKQCSLLGARGPFFLGGGDSGEECGRALEAGTSKSGPAIY